ncbi:MAG: hypothetical protein V2I46_08165 [Bacteroides sp.]|jgi:hypothetical protein|nr:hypothetical protein [Bacteroides sp.]
MENQSQPGSDKRNEKIYKGTIVVLLLIIGVLAVMLFTSRQSFKVEREAATVVNTELQEELDSLMAEYNLVKLEYDSVLVDKDSIIMANAEEIQKLISSQADYYRIRRQLNLLQEVTQNYVRDIDSLVTLNQVLKDENIAFQEEIQRATIRTTELEQDKDELTSKVEVASALRAYQISAEAIRIRSRGREEATDRASRAEQIKVCFTLPDNPVARTGEHNVYLRIAKPDGSILRVSDDEAYSFVIEGDTLQYSSKTVVDYQNQVTDACLYWQRIEEFEPGLYLISLFTDDFRLGEAAITLK